jgi:hypothetical protein
LTGTKREKEIRVAGAILGRAGKRRAQIFASPLVKEVFAGSDFYDLVALLVSRKSREVREEIAAAVNGDDRDFGRSRQGQTWLPRGSLGGSVSELRASILNPKNTGDEIAHRRAQKISGVKIFIVNSTYSQVLSSAYGAPHDRGVAFVLYNPAKGAWGYLEVGGRFLQAPENIRDPDVVRILGAL